MTAVTETENTTPTIQADAEKPLEDGLFKWSRWVHVGVGAQECEHATDGRCQRTFNPHTGEGHFHAWVRLPNPFQIRDITEKASAARARRHRMLRDTDSDARVILEDELDVLRDIDKSLLVDEIVEQDFTEDYVKAVREVDDEPDPDYTPENDEEIPKRFANIDQDREEYERQRVLPEEQHTEDFPVMEHRLAEYSRAIELALERIQQPKRDALMEREVDDLVGIIRRKRINDLGDETYLHWFNTWQWFVCTFKPAGEKAPHERVWSDINQMRMLGDTQVILALREAFNELESQLAKSRMGKGV